MSWAPSMSLLPGSYSPTDTEPAIRRRWSESDAFHALPPGPDDEAVPTFCILIPPPNVTAPLHLGQALNNTLQDILVRHHRMLGDRTLWMPGTDHAGIATQSVVEKRLLQEGRRRTDFTREAFIKHVQAWKDEYEATIIEQLQSMGASCDWARTRFTMDDMCTRAVREAFFRLFRDGLIYRGKRLVNWDPVTRTALADDEVEMEEVAGHMYYLRYPLEDSSGHVTVATTRPETMLGDTAIAIHPADPRSDALRGTSVRLPIVDRLIPIIEDDHVVRPGTEDDPKAAFTTGFLKVTPAHDPNDWEIGLRHGLDVINVMGPDASISDAHGWKDVSPEARRFVGMSREDARDAILDWFREHGLLEDIRDYQHTVGHSYRSHVPIEPWLSDQWYVRVTDDRLGNEALRAMTPAQHEGVPPARQDGSARPGDGELTFHPARYARTFQAWHESLRDWCVSRQLWWGHRIPVWTRTLPPEQTFEPPDDPLAGLAALDVDVPADAAGAVALLVARDDELGSTTVHACPGPDHTSLEAALEDAGFQQDPDVLDTWFSSALWPISTMGWPDPGQCPSLEGLLETFNPSSVLCTGRDIITLWVGRMTMFNRLFRDGSLPFRDVTIHPMIQDGHGQRMSKSLSNGVDPRDIIQSHGADAMRFVLAQLATSTQDVRVPVDLVCPHTGRTFTPEFVTSPAGHHVAAPIQECPEDPSRHMVTSYGVLSGQAVPSDAERLASNTSARFDLGRNFCNKLWNATRFSLGTITDPLAGASGDRPLLDRWILGRLHDTVGAVNDALRRYQFNDYATAMYDFVWRDLCDWHLESIKPTVRDDPAQQQVLLSVLDATLRLLHPVCPFITEALWPHVTAAGTPGLEGLDLPGTQLLAIAAWPSIDAGFQDVGVEERVSRMHALVTEVRRLRAEHAIPDGRKVGLAAPSAVIEMIGGSEPAVHALCRVDRIEAIEDACPEGALPTTFEGGPLHVLDLLDAVDIKGERARLAGRIESLHQAIEGFEAKLSNPGYTSGAPPEVVQETRDRKVKAEADLEAAAGAMRAMEGA